MIYSTTLYLIGNITYKLTNNFLYSLFSSFSLFLIYPWPTSPWPNFISFFFLVLSYSFYISRSVKKNFLSGIMLGFSYISLTIVYNFVVLFFLSTLVFLIFLLKKNFYNLKKKIIILIIGFFIIFFYL